MDSAKKYSWTLSQSGKISVSHQQMNGIVKDKVHIQCDCTSDSLLSDIVQADMQGDHPIRIEPNWLEMELRRKDAEKEAAVSAGVTETGKVGIVNRRTLKEKTLVMQVSSIELMDSQLVVKNGRLTLQGEEIIVRDGITYFQSKSQLPKTNAPPILTGSQINRKRLEAMAAKGELHDLYFGNGELLDGQRTLIENPEIHLDSHVIPLEEIAQARSSAEGISLEMLETILPNHQEFINEIEAQVYITDASQGLVTDENTELTKIVLLNGKCVLKDNYIVIMRGLLHVGCAWHRVFNGLLIGKDSNRPAHPVIITGTPVYKDAAECAQLLLNNVVLYSRGNTIYAGNTALLKDSVLHADNKMLGVSVLHRNSLCGIKAPADSEPARIFVQGGKFSVSDSSLEIFEGNVWFKDVKVNVPGDSAEEVRIKDAMVFVSPEADAEGQVKKAQVFENRDIIYKDNMLLMDDLTPILKGGFICHESQEQPLEWFSERPQRPESTLVTSPSQNDNLCNRDRVLVGGTCIADNTGMYVMKGTILIKQKTVIIEKGVPLYSSDFDGDEGQQILGLMPPRLVGRVMLNAGAAKQMDAKLVKGFIILNKVRLDIREGKGIINKMLPIMADCKLVFNRRVYNAPELGVEPEIDIKDKSQESGQFSDQTDSERSHAPDKDGKPKPYNKVKNIKAYATETEDSGRGLSDGTDIGHRGADSGQGYFALPGSPEPKGGQPLQGAISPRSADAGLCQRARVLSPRAPDQTSCDKGGEGKDGQPSPRHDGSPQPDNQGTDKGEDEQAADTVAENVYRDDAADVDKGADGVKPSKKVGGEPTVGPDDALQPKLQASRRKQDGRSAGSGGEKTTENTDQLADLKIKNTFVPMSNLGINGKISVRSSNNQHRLIFNLQTRVEEILHFLDSQI